MTDKEAFVKISLAEAKHLKNLINECNCDEGISCEDCLMMLTKMSVVIKGLESR